MGSTDTENVIKEHSASDPKKDKGVICKSLCHPAIEFLLFPGWSSGASTARELGKTKVSVSRIPFTSVGGCLKPAERLLQRRSKDKCKEQVSSQDLGQL